MESVEDQTRARIAKFQKLWRSKRVFTNNQGAWKVCKGERNTAGGFHWKFVNPEDVRTNEPLKFTKIQQWSFDGKTLIAEYDSLNEATRVTNSGSRTISKCCKGKARSAGGFKWKSV